MQNDEDEQKTKARSEGEKCVCVQRVCMQREGKEKRRRDWHTLGVYKFKE